MKTGKEQFEALEIVNYPEELKREALDKLDFSINRIKTFINKLDFNNFNHLDESVEFITNTLLEMYLQHEINVMYTPPKSLKRRENKLKKEIKRSIDLSIYN